MARKPIPKNIREQVYRKCNGHCAYCGCELDYIVCASKLYGGKHVMEELDNRYKNKLMS